MSDMLPGDRGQQLRILELVGRFVICTPSADLESISETRVTTWRDRVRGAGMNHRHDRRGGNRDEKRAEASEHLAGAPGKRTLVDRLQPTGQVQRRANGAQEEAAIHDAAARGVATGSSPLPFRDTIQRAFGRHDISTVEGHTGPDAAASARAMG